MAHKVTLSTVTTRKNYFLKNKLADKHLYSNGIFNATYLRLDDSKMAKWIYHIYKTKLGFTLKKCRHNQYL